jgi:hypothetical protein
MRTANARLNSALPGHRGQPFTLRFDVGNLLDPVYELPDGTGIAVLAPPFGPPRTYLVAQRSKMTRDYLKVSLETLETDQPH